VTDDARRSIAESVALAGIGLHTGAAVNVTLNPAPPESGIVFVRGDLPGEPRIETTAHAVRNTDRRTTLGAGPATVDTVEHLLAAVMALGLDDLIVRLDGPELPIFDGSAQRFFTALTRAGVQSQPGRKRRRRIRDALTFNLDHASYQARPCPGVAVIDVQIEFDHPAINRQRVRYDVRSDTFETSLAGARTFGFAHELVSLRSRGLIEGASPGTAILLDDHGVAHGGPLRWPDEFVRHKAVDLMGDLALLGTCFEGEITAMNPGHRANSRFVSVLGEHCT
jgi:UDP-3-O-acyl N-acetylglucosamine deacetylase